jgi:hypothetical protein
MSPVVEVSKVKMSTVSDVFTQDSSGTGYGLLGKRILFEVDVATDGDRDGIC